MIPSVYEMSDLNKVINDKLSKSVRVFNASNSSPEAQMPFQQGFMWVSPFGIPRRINPLEVRQFAKSAWVQMVVNAILKQVRNTKYDVVNVDDDDNTVYEKETSDVFEVLDCPNRNNQTFWDVWLPYLRDILELDSGVVFKGFNGDGKLVELFAHDGSKFLISTDEHGILNKYYQYSYAFPTSRPKEFEKSQIVYGMMNLSTENYPYGFCLDYGSLIETNEGLLKIGDVVTNKKEVLIKTFNQKKECFEYKPILNYFSRKVSEYLYSIKLSNGQRGYGIHCTNNHPILTPNGYVNAEDLKTFDKILVKGKTLTKEQKEYIYGTMLGDGNLYCKRRKGYPSIRLAQSIKHEEYIDWMQESLYNLDLWKQETYAPSPHYPERLYKHIKLNSKVDPCLDEIRWNCYPNYKKTVTKEWVSKLTPLSISAWMMDDGSWTFYRHNKELIEGFIFCTDDFSKEECGLLVDKLKGWDIESKIMCPPSTGKNRLWVNKKNTIKLMDLTKDYINVNVETHEKKWIAKPLKVVESETSVEVPITSISRLKVKTGTVYDIEVKDNHNFITNRMIVHNSPLQSIQQVVEVLIQSDRYNKEFFKSNGVPAGIVNVNMDEPELQRFKTYWQNEIKGKPHALAFMNSPDVGFNDLSKSNRDMEWLDGQKWYFHLVFGAYGLSPQEVGFYENSNRSTGESQERITVKNAIKPYLSHIAEKINNEVLPLILLDDKPKIKFKWFPEDDVAERIKDEQLQWKLKEGVYSINEVRSMEGKDSVEGGDEHKGKNSGSMQFEGDSPFGNQPVKPNDTKGEKDGEKKKSVLIKEAEMVEESREYDVFLTSIFKGWEKKVLGYVDSSLTTELNKMVKVDKSLGEFMSGLFNTVNTSKFFTGLKRVIGFKMRDGLDEAEEELDLNISVDWENKKNEETSRQLDGFTLDNGEYWPGLKGVSRDLSTKVLDIVRDSMKEGSSVVDVKKEIKETFKQYTGSEASEGRADMIARTETTRLFNKYKLEGYKSSGLKGFKVWDSFIDDSTSSECRELNGQKRGLTEVFSLKDGREFMHPPSHVSCRSRVLFELEE